MDAGGHKGCSRAAVGPPRGGDDERSVRLVGRSALFQQVLRVADAVARNDCVVLLEGESGTGKELLARRIHLRGARADRPFIPVNCAAVSDSLFESQFYGHVKGAFTGAATSALGVVRAADGGTLLLDEIGELPLHLQPKLLRLLQEHEVIPVGAAEPVPVDARFIASTNRRLAEAVAASTFRSDLYHRLNIVRIEVPPLRVRPEDVEPLLEFYLDRYARHYHRPRCRLSGRLRSVLRQYPWPGNVRELSAYVERLYAADLPPMPPKIGMWLEHERAFAEPLRTAPGRMPVVESTPVGCSLAEAERQAIRNALELTGYNRTAAAKVLQIHRSTLLRKIKAYGLSVPS
jgi:transcriptional regulator with PAS, ATPase and Fis domain